MMKKQINVEIDIDTFEKDCKIIKIIYNTMAVLDNFCGSHDCIEEIKNIAPIVNYLKNESDELYFNFLTIKHGHENKISDKQN